jgi:hypothetical protein
MPLPETMWLLILLASTPAQIYTQEALRKLPTQLKQKRIHEKVQEEVILVQTRILQEASVNHTSLNFTLYCIDPNRQYRENQKMVDRMSNGRVPQEDRPYYTFPLTYGLGGYYEYQREGHKYRYSKYEERHQETELIWPRPYCEPKLGYELYQRLHGNLEDTPSAYSTLFFQKLNTLFPDIRLVVSRQRPSEGLYDSDCCPLFTVSW